MERRDLLKAIFKMSFNEVDSIFGFLKDEENNKWNQESGQFLFRVTVFSSLDILKI